MKKFMAVLIGTAFVTSTIGLAGAQTTTTTPAPAEKKAADKPMEKKAEKKMAAKTANGVVKSASADSIVVTGKEKGKDAEWTFAVDSKTKIKKGGKEVTAADVKAGDSVNVRYMDHEGKTVASAVNVKPAATAKKDETAAKKDEMKKPAADSAAKPGEKKQ